jgi:hypothetical protein
MIYAVPVDFEHVKHQNDNHQEKEIDHLPYLRCTRDHIQGECNHYRKVLHL